MATGGIDRYFTYEARLASFQKSAKKRGSTASGRGKALNWPHKQIAPANLAKAGFYFSPTPDHPDSVTCFLCGKGLDGWESGDDPLLEHLKHASDCGWAVVAAVEAEVGDYGKEDPSLPYMVEARKATFAGRWPHEAKKGWKCKTKQLVEAGWIYSPAAESDDKATCPHCQLVLDGWEPGDKPYDEHYSRSPHCAFFALVAQFGGGRKRTAGRGKAARGSKASRLSAQSVATTSLEPLSAADATADVDDSVLTTASAMAQGGRKTKAKKAAAAKGGRSKAKKNKPAESEDAHQPEEEAASQPQPAKATRGKKRGSDAIEDSLMFMSEAPAPKKRATRARSSTATDASTVTPDDSEIADAPAPARKVGGRTRGPGSRAAASRQPSALSTVSTASMASLRAPPGDFPDDEEIERQLEEDLAREWSDDEPVAHGSAPDASGQGSTAAQNSADYAMFDPAAAEPDDAAVEEELRALQAEMQVDEPEPEQLQVPKKGRKAGTRKASKQTRTKKTKAATPPPEELPEEKPETAEPPSEGAVEEPHDVTVGSTDTVVKPAESGAAGTIKRGRGRPSKPSSASQQPAVAEKAPAQPPAKRGRGRPSKASLVSQASADTVELVEPAEQPSKRGRGSAPKTSLASQGSDGGAEPKPAEAPAKRGRGRPPKKAEAPMEAESPQPATATGQEAAADDVTDTAHVVETGEAQVAEKRVAPPATSQDAPSPGGPPGQRLNEPPSTPSKAVSPAPSARQPASSPSRSPPQSLDAENQPPSSRPAASAAPKRVVLALALATPTRGSPSKRNVLAGLESSMPWTAANLDAILGTPRSEADKENVAGRFLRQGKELTSPEKRMTVEEWIYFNAAEAEKRLKHECEAMVSRFEREGTRAMNVLEGLAVE